MTGFHVTVSTTLFDPVAWAVSSPGASSESSSLMVSVGFAEVKPTRGSSAVAFVARLIALFAASTRLFTAVSVLVPVVEPAAMVIVAPVLPPLSV